MRFLFLWAISQIFLDENVLLKQKQTKKQCRWYDNGLISESTARTYAMYHPRDNVNFAESHKQNNILLVFRCSGK